MHDTSTARNRFVDVASGEVARDIFVDEAIYKDEQKAVFAKAWLYVGHESQIPKSGDFFLSRMGEESVILTRDRSETIRVFLNSCRHRGMRVCRYDEGNTSVFYCPYHGWSYGLDGRLKSVTDYKNAYKEGFDLQQWGLVEVAKLAKLGGTVWATWDPDAPEFKDYLGDAYEHLGRAFTAWDGEGETELLGSPQKWRIPSNWKIVAENFAGDMLHNVSHQSVNLIGINPSGKSAKEMDGRRDTGFELHLSAFPEGHGLINALYPADTIPAEYAASPVTAAYFAEQWRKRVTNLGEKARAVAGVGTIFPNTSFHGQQPRTILVAHPVSVSETEMWRVYFVDKNAPDEVKDFLRKYYMRYSGPAGLTEQDDMENWNYATSAGRGTVSGRFPYNYKAGLNNSGSHDLIPGRVNLNGHNTEENARALYNRWAAYMDADASGGEVAQ